MSYLQRIDYRPNPANLSEAEEKHLAKVLDVYGAEIVVYGEPVRWEHIEEVEVVPAPHMAGPAGWIVGKLLMGGRQFYHLGIYFGSREAILPNITLNTARHVLELIAFYAPNPVAYQGPEDLVLLSEI
ncbi:MAG: hypothetical protein OHK0046_44340 [Anaerolineae bacterium]